MKQKRYPYQIWLVTEGKLDHVAHETTEGKALKVALSWIHSTAREIGDRVVVGYCRYGWDFGHGASLFPDEDIVADFGILN